MKPRNPFAFKEFVIHQENVSLPVTTDACLFGAYVKFNDASSILDLGTGTGLLMFILNQRYPSSKITGIELQENAFECTLNNIKINKKEQQLHVMQGDFFTFPYTNKFQSIICNPPFFKNSLISKSKSEAIAKHFSEYTFKNLFNLIYELLMNKGEAWLMLPNMSIEEINNSLICTELVLQEQILIKSKQNKQPHICFIKLVSDITCTSKTEITEIVVYDDENKYTTQSKKILSLIYLHLMS